MSDEPATEVARADSLPDPVQFGPGAVLLYDEALTRHFEGFAEWAAAFPRGVSVRAGEALKAVGGFPEYITRLAQAFAGRSRTEATLVCAGGGSVGDFGGFCASVLQRGIRLVHVPSTWLAAVDSAHGGKNALNVGGAKNQIGTFYEPVSVHLVSELLQAQPEELAQEGMSELVKIALLAGGSWASRLLQEDLNGTSRGSVLWELLPSAIEAKYQVVARDPTERSGERQILNLGHTLGHVLEAHYGLSHGESVAKGLHFTLEWSTSVDDLDPRRCVAFREAVIRLTGYSSGIDGHSQMPKSTFRTLLTADKKMSGEDRHSGVTFIFLRDLGTPIRKQIPLDLVVAQAKRAGWIK